MFDRVASSLGPGPSGHCGFRTRDSIFFHYIGLIILKLQGAWSVIFLRCSMFLPVQHCWISILLNSYHSLIVSPYFVEVSHFYSNSPLEIVYKIPHFLISLLDLTHELHKTF